MHVFAGAMPVALVLVAAGVMGWQLGLPSRVEAELSQQPKHQNMRIHVDRAGWDVIKHVAQAATSTPEGRKPTTSQLTWNVWGEPKNERRWAPSLYLKPGSAYRITVDLAAMAYATSGVISSQIQDDFKRMVEAWRNDGTQEVTVKLVVLHDPGKFERPSVPDSRMIVELAKISRLPVRTTPVRDPFAVLRKNRNPSFLFGRAEFEVRTRSAAAGRAALGFSVWVNDRPVEEFSADFCIAPDQIAAKRCGVPALPYTLKGVDSLRLAAERGPTPNAALHFVELDGMIHGVLWQSTSNKFLTWRLDKLPSGLESFLANSVMPIFFKATDPSSLQSVGRAFYNTLFPTPEANDARAAFEAFVRSHPRITNRPHPTFVAPSIFVRTVLPSLNHELMLPLGFLLVDDDFVGFSFRVELPLPIQTYEPGKACLTRWVMALPAAGGGGPELEDALNVFATRIDSAQGWVTRGATVHREMGPVRAWLADGQRDSEPMAFFVVSHHDSDTIYFQDNLRILSTNIERTFDSGSIAVLNGCGTGKPGATDFIGKLNKKGVAAAIATATEVNGEMAGHFLACLTDAVDLAPSPTVRFVQFYFSAIHCLRNTTGKHEVNPYGGRALAYLLLGNGNLLLCAPRKAP